MNGEEHQPFPAKLYVRWGEDGTYVIADADLNEIDDEGRVGVYLLSSENTLLIRRELVP